MPLLELDRGTKRYGSLTVVDELTLRVDAGEVLGVIGPNGAGKTTALSMIAGQVSLDAGSVRFDGADITTLPVHARAALGIGRTFQVPQPFSNMTVFENTMVGALQTGHDHVDPQALAVEALARTDLLDRANSPAAALTLLERKRLELARALAVEPRVVLLDESAGGLTEAEVDELLPTIEEIRSGGTAVIWIEHVLHALTAIADRVVCVDRGKKLVEDTPQEAMSSPAVREIYLGTIV